MDVRLVGRRADIDPGFTDLSPPPSTPPPEPSAIPRRPALSSLHPAPANLANLLLSLPAATLARQQLSTLPDVLNPGTLH